MRLQVRSTEDLPDFLDLPFDGPLAGWDSARIVELPRGIHRNVVRFGRWDEGLFVVKEIPDRLARREYDLLWRLDQEGVDAARSAALVTRRRTADGDALPGLVVTRHLAYALPYRLLFARESHVHLRKVMVDALAELLVRIHLVGFFWGDCSLSNALFRRDASRLTAYLIDAETGEIHDQLSAGQRAHDLDLAVENCAGELFDLIAQGVVVPEADPVRLAEELTATYQALWQELTREETFSRDEAWRVRDRLRRINDLGYDVDEVELLGEGDQVRLRLSTRVVEPGRHRRRLLELTGLRVAGDEQALRLLNDVRGFGAWLELDEGRPFSLDAMAHRWTDDVFEVAIAMIPPRLFDRREPAQVFVEMLDHRELLSRSLARDVSNAEALASYVTNVLRFTAPERIVEDDGA